jgi:Secretion system C-terminal sorting domain
MQTILSNNTLLHYKSVQSAQSNKSVIPTNSMGVYKNSSTSPLNEEENMINGVKKVEKSNFIIYPNPTNGQVTIEYYLLPNEIGEIIIYDMLGKELQTIDLNNDATRVTTILDFSKGVYVAKFMVNNKLIEVNKIVVE